MPTWVVTVVEEMRTPQLDRLATEGIRFRAVLRERADLLALAGGRHGPGQYPNRWGVTSYISDRQHNQRRGIGQLARPGRALPGP